MISHDSINYCIINHCRLCNMGVEIFKVMNWKEIVTQCPKAWTRLSDEHETRWPGVDHPDCVCVGMLDWDSWELRHLYDFFDENGIHLGVRETIQPLGSYHEWVCTIHCWEPYKELYVRSEKKHHFETRSEVEEAAFTKAFELLEERL